MSTNADSLVRDAISAYRAGKKDQARSLLLQAVDLDEHHEQGWLWLSAVVDTVEDQITCLENVLTINPNNEKAKQGLQLLNEKSRDQPAVTTPQSQQKKSDPEDEDPFANISFTSPAPMPGQVATPVETPASDNEEEELPDQVEWGTIATSSASARRPMNEPTPDDYSDWIAGLNIGSNEATEAFGPVEDDEPAFNASPFVSEDDVLSRDAPFELDRNVFGFDDDEEIDIKDGAGPFTTSPFSADADLEDELPARPVPPPVAPTPSASTPRPVSTPPRPPVSSDDDLLLADIETGEDFDDSDFLDDDFDQGNLGTVDPSEFFQFIPSEIKPTRLPGTNERYPALVIIGLLLLVIFNGSALALVWMTLTSAS